MEAQRQRLSFEGQQNFNIDMTNFVKALYQLKQEEILYPNLHTYYKGTINTQHSRL